MHMKQYLHTFLAIVQLAHKQRVIYIPSNLFSQSRIIICKVSRGLTSSLLHDFIEKKAFQTKHHDLHGVHWKAHRRRAKFGHLVAYKGGRLSSERWPFNHFSKEPLAVKTRQTCSHGWRLSEGPGMKTSDCANSSKYRLMPSARTSTNVRWPDQIKEEIKSSKKRC